MACGRLSLLPRGPLLPWTAAAWTTWTRPTPCRALSSRPPPPLYPSHIPTSPLQKALLFAGSAVLGLTDPWRADMVAVNGEVSGRPALARIHADMLRDEEGRRVLEQRPRINTKTVDFDYLKSLPPSTWGHTYATYCHAHRITPDSRDTVHFVDDADLAYVMQRYRETHDLTHAVLDMPTNLVGEVAVKWVEALQLGLPMCAGAAVFGPVRFTARQSRQFRQLRPWAVKVGRQAKPLMNVFFEERWEQDVLDLRRELNIDPAPRVFQEKK